MNNRRDFLSKLILIPKQEDSFKWKEPSIIVPTRRNFFKSLMFLTPMLFLPQFAGFFKWRSVITEPVFSPEFTQFLINMAPRFDELIMQDIRPTDTWLLDTSTGTFPWEPAPILSAREDFFADRPDLQALYPKFT